MRYRVVYFISSYFNKRNSVFTFCDFSKIYPSLSEFNVLHSLCNIPNNIVRLFAPRHYYFFEKLKIVEKKVLNILNGDGLVTLDIF